MSHELFVVGDAKQHVEDPGYWFSVQHELLYGFATGDGAMFTPPRNGQTAFASTRFPYDYAEDATIVGSITPQGVIKYGKVDSSFGAYVYATTTHGAGTTIAGPNYADTEGRVVTYSEDGGLLWGAEYAVVGGGTWYPLHSASDNAHVYLIGNLDAYHMVLVKVSASDGSVVFVKELYDSPAGDVSGTGVSVSSGVIYASGRIKIGAIYYCLVAAFSLDGTKLWDKRYQLSGRSIIGVHEILEAEDGLYVAFTSRGSYDEAAVMKLDFSGDIVWCVRQASGAGTENSWVGNMVLSGADLCIGFTNSPPGYVGPFRSFFTSLVGATGASQATREITHDTSPSVDIRPVAIEGDALYVGGRINFGGWGDPTDYDALTVGRIPKDGNASADFGSVHVATVSAPYSFESITGSFTVVPNVLTVVSKDMTPTSITPELVPMTTHYEIS